jgi:hypothetical protein
MRQEGMVKNVQNPNVSAIISGLRTALPSETDGRKRIVSIINSKQKHWY